MPSLNQNELYICWSAKIRSKIEEAGFELWQDEVGLQDNPFLDAIVRYDNQGQPRKKQCWGYIYERTPELMELISKYSDPDKVRKYKEKLNISNLKL